MGKERKGTNQGFDSTPATTTYVVHSIKEVCCFVWITWCPPHQIQALLCYKGYLYDVVSEMILPRNTAEANRKLFFFFLFSFFLYNMCISHGYSAGHLQPLIAQ